MLSTKLLDTYPIISEQVSREALSVVLEELENVLTKQVKGDVAEFGCYIGTTSLFIRRLLDQAGQSDQRRFYAYDSFRGLPSKTIQDASAAGSDFKAGELQVSKKQFLKEFNRARLVAPITHKAWFSELNDEQLPATLAFAFLDGDFYESIFSSLRIVWPRLRAGGTITIDDYDNDKLPGVERAIRDFFGGHPPAIHHTHNIGILRKL